MEHHERSSITEAAKFYNVQLSTISKYAETGKLWDQKFLLTRSVNL